ncbi:MAG: DNA replication/repair protein RecF [Lachnospiraceae bacterium]|nr:DNA replication/repair protein RecF [Lachnospiraceae bacterium]
MQIKTLELNNYRNYESLAIEFSPGVNIIYGENAQGKTNILESIYMCGTGKSHKGSKEREIIRQGCDEAHIKGEFTGDLGNIRVDVHLRKSKGKGIALNRIPIKKISELYGRIYTVIFSTEDLDIIRRSPVERRRFMDMELCQIDPIYVEDLINYNRILNQRRELLRKMDEVFPTPPDLLETLDVWDLQLVNYGSRIIKRRRQFIDEINSIIFDIHYDITSGEEKLKLIYEPSVDEDSFYETLIKNREKDRAQKVTGAGPHRDDFSFYDGDRNLKVFGSNGQQRTCALSLKLSEIRIIENIKKEKPVLLLDDVLSELDRKRQRKLLQSIGETQTIVTCTGVDEFVEQEIGEAKKFYIKNAAIVSENKEG